jgi:hypothetical protein
MGSLMRTTIFRVDDGIVIVLEAKRLCGVESLSKSLYARAVTAETVTEDEGTASQLAFTIVDYRSIMMCAIAQDG